MNIKKVERAKGNSDNRRSDQTNAYKEVRMARGDDVKGLLGIWQEATGAGDVTELVSGKKKGVPPWLSRP